MSEDFGSFLEYHDHVPKVGKVGISLYPILRTVIDYE